MIPSMTLMGERLSDVGKSTQVTRKSIAGFISGPTGRTGNAQIADSPSYIAITYFVFLFSFFVVVIHTFQCPLCQAIDNTTINSCSIIVVNLISHKGEVTESMAMMQQAVRWNTSNTAIHNTQAATQSHSTLTSTKKKHGTKTTVQHCTVHVYRSVLRKARNIWTTNN